MAVDPDARLAVAGDDGLARLGNDHRDDTFRRRVNFQFGDLSRDNRHRRRRILHLGIGYGQLLSGRA